MMAIRTELVTQSRKKLIEGGWFKVNMHFSLNVLSVMRYVKHGTVPMLLNSDYKFLDSGFLLICKLVLDVGLAKVMHTSITL